ncbi:MULTISPECIES: DUF7692 domain-containing protein [Halomicrobium]|uniref:DUF7692 domain-containing protein n=1 Tax=Halomicrobium mukohataei (strain ATCC 700874 / DSM 12286 / JCM 9738 / NCIMB 13541) TaxID=485914 RepID=C7NWE9_HALMD|nr:MULTISPECIES: hypothetical protein [Halomicrobium]ACV46290.1 hypothetical protein Hmuk_0152 [Halomicrobium mukohataei DSM 12286]
MRIPGDGTHAHRTETIEQAAERWHCNKTTALVQSAGFSRRIDERIREVLARDDLTVRQRREAAETLRVPGTTRSTSRRRLLSIRSVSTSMATAMTADTIGYLPEFIVVHRSDRR